MFVTLIVCLTYVISPAYVENLWLFVCYLLWMFLHFFIKLYWFLCLKSKKHIKSGKSKSLIDIIVYCHKHVLPCTFVLMGLCIYERSFFFMHSYQCGKNLDIYVIVVNISSNLSWMISQWFCWSWNLHRLVPIHLPTCLLFLLKELNKCRSQNEKR